MKVYILLGSFNYEGDSVIGVFSSEEKADEFLDKALREKKFLYDDYRVEEWDVED